MGKYFSTYFSPNRGTADVIIGFIDRCKSTLDIAIYSLTHDDISDALIRAHERGVKIRILIDKTQAGNQYADDEKLEAAGIEVQRDIKGGLMHCKYAICDIDGESPAVMTGSFNWTMNADTKNVENMVIVRLKYAIQEFSEHFDYIWDLNHQ